MATASRTESSDREIVITREFNASRKLVWEVWTETGHIEKWFGPKGFSTRVDELDFRAGGTARYTMIGPDGAEYPSKGVFIEIDPPSKIVTTDEFGEDYKALHSDLPQGMVLTALFDDLGEKTRLTLRITHPTAEDRTKHEEMGVVDGWNSSFDKMDEYLEEINKN